MFTTCCRRHAASSGQRGASCTRYDARRARRRRRDQARREFTVLAGNWASSDTAARAATASRRVVHCTAQLALLRRAKRVPPPPPPLLKRSGVSVKTGPRLRDDMSIHTKRPSYFLSKGYRSARYFRHRFWQPHPAHRKSTGGNPFHGQIQELKRKAQMLWPVPRNGETRRWRRTCRTRLASNI